MPNLFIGRHLIPTMHLIAMYFWISYGICSLNFRGGKYHDLEELETETPLFVVLVIDH